MDYQEWLPLFGLAATDPKVVAALAAHGVTKPVTLPPETSTTGVDFKPHGFGLGFTSEFTLSGGVADLPILASVIFVAIPGKSSKGWRPYSGSLPHGLAKSDSKDEVVGKLGEPASLDNFFCSAGWDIDGLSLGISFSDDWKQIKQLGLSLPGAL
jgi:hypothetical protein